jgi:hypothetical protein
MMHPYSSGTRWLAVPGIGFPQHIPVGPDALDPEDFRDRSSLAHRKTHGQDGASTPLIDGIASRSSSWPWLSVQW